MSSSYEEKVEKVLEEIGVKDPEHLSRVEAAIALGKLLAVKVRRDSSVHEVTKETRRALEMVVRNPLKEDIDSVVKTSIYTNPPFESYVLNEAYRKLLEKLLRETARLIEGKNPMWRRKIVNLTIENIYNVARDAREEYKDKINKIFEIIAQKSEKPEEGEGS